MVAFEKNGLKIMLFPKKQPDGSSFILAKFQNNLDVPMTSFVFEAAVPKYVRLQMQPASGQILPPHSDVVSQSMICVNTSNGERGLLMKLRIVYAINGAPVQDMGQVGNFPAGY